VKFNRIGLCLIALASIFNTGCCCETIKPGYVGVIVPLYGSKEAKKDYDIAYGRVWYNPLATEIYTFPIFMQQPVWHKDGPDGDESITFNTAEGNSVNCDVALAYSIKEDKVTTIFREQRRDIDGITNVYLRSKVRDAFVRHGGKALVHEVMGSGKEKVLTDVTNDLKEELESKGYVIDMVSIVGEMRVDSKVIDAISATITQQQKALEADAKVKQSEAEARQAVAVAKGKADAQKAEAEGKAAATLAIAEAESKANQLLQQSITPDLLKYQTVEKWDGKLPTLMSGQSPLPFIQVPDSK